MAEGLESGRDRRVDALTPGTRLGTYEIVALLGAGGMGEVYRAKDLRLGRDIALKVLPARMSADTGRLARFEREARTVAGLNHPNIVMLHSVEDDGDVRFLTMELVEGSPSSITRGILAGRAAERSIARTSRIRSRKLMLSAVRPTMRSSGWSELAATVTAGSPIRRRVAISAPSTAIRAGERFSEKWDSMGKSPVGFSSEPGRACASQRDSSIRRRARHHEMQPRPRWTRELKRKMRGS